ncbi:MAG: glycosyltransferase family 39 protein [Raineya sp.]|nr:glycosyltransferase family 39 protein [Raineya sp.]
MNFALLFRQNLLFAFLIIFLLIFAVTNFDGYYFYDDTTYAYYAYQIKQGTFQIDNPDIFAHRWGLIVPLAFSYTIFGVSDFATILVPFLATLTSFFLFYTWVKKNLHSPQKEIALLLFTLDFYTLFFANKLYPDVLLTTLILGAIILLWKRKNSFRKGLLFAFLNFWGFLCKETILFAMPFYIGVCIYDVLKRQNLHFWLSAFISGFALFALYSIFYAYFTQTPFFKFTLIQAGHTDYVQFRSEDFLLERLSYAPFLMFIQTGLIVSFAGALLRIFALNRNLQNFTTFNTWFFALALLSFWFMPVDFRNYTPIYLLPRHILFLVPLSAIVSAEVVCKKPYNIFTAILMFISAVLAYQTLGWKVAILYACLAVLWLTSNPKREGECMTSPPSPLSKGEGERSLPIISLIGIKRAFRLHNFQKLKNLLKFLKIEVLLLFFLLLHPVYTMLKPTETGYKYEKQIFQTYQNLFQQPCVVFTDDKLVSGHRWYFRFEVPQGVLFRNFEDLPQFAESKFNKYVIINEYSIAYFELIGTQFPEWVKKIPSNWRKISSFEKVHLYQIP